MAKEARESALFVYGSLIGAARRGALLGREVPAFAARLPGYARRRGRYFYLVKRAGAETSGLVLSGLGAAELEILDRYEEVPRRYVRERVEVVGADGRKLRCWVYLPTARITHHPR